MIRYYCSYLLIAILIFGNPTEDLFNSVKNLDVTGVQTAIANNANVNSKDEFGKFPLDYLVDSDMRVKNIAISENEMINMFKQNMEDRYKIVKILLDEDANINITKDFKENIFFYLIEQLSVIIPGNEDEIENYYKFICRPGKDLFNLLLDSGVDLKTITIDENNLRFNLLDRILYMYIIKKSYGEGEKDNLEEIVETLLNKGLRPLNKQLLLNYGVKLNNKKIVQKMLDEEAEINGIVNDEAPIFIAAEMNNVDMVKFLEDRGAYINGKDEKNRTPMSIAVQNSCLEVVKYLSEKDYDVNQLTNFGSYLILDALYCQKWEEDNKGKEIVKILLERDDINLNFTTDGIIENHFFGGAFGFSPLAMCSNLEIIKTMVEKGADVNFKSYQGTTAIMNTLNIEKIKFLLSKGANVNTLDNDGNSALINIIKNLKLYDIYYYFDEMTPEVPSVLPVVKLFIEKGVNIDIVNNEGNNAFIYAAKNNCVDVLEFLIEKGTNIRFKNNEGQNALLISTDEGNYEASKLLIEKGLKVNSADNVGRTPLMNSIASRKIELIKLLIEKGADINAKTLEGKTVLEIAKESNNQEVVELLIKNGAK